MRGIKFLAAAAVVAALASSGRAAVTVGVWDSGNCYPFSCAAYDGVTLYQQVYSASEFPGLTSFDQISFFQDPNFPGLMDTADYQISFSTTSAAVGGLDTTDPNNNIGPDSQLFGNFTIGGPMPAVLTLTGTTFNYDPSAGNLLMTVAISNLVDPHGYESFFKADYTGVETSRLFGDSGAYFQGTGALVTEFGLAPTAVPEPASLALAGFGAAGALGLGRRRARSKSAA